MNNNIPASIYLAKIYFFSEVEMKKYWSILQERVFEWFSNQSIYKFFQFFISTIPTKSTKYKKYISLAYDVALTKNKSDLDKNDYYTLRQWSTQQQNQFLVNQTCKSNKHMYVCKSSFCDAILLFYNENEFCNQVYVIWLQYGLNELSGQSWTYIL